MRRALLAADVARPDARSSSPRSSSGPGDVAARLARPVLGEAIVFLLTLPLWVVAAKLYGLYDRDEEQVDHSTGRRPHRRLPPRHRRYLARLRGHEADAASPNPNVSRLVFFWARRDRSS